MSKKLQKSLQDYLSKIKKPYPNVHFPPTTLSTSKKWSLKGCKHPKTVSFAVNGEDGQGHVGDIIGEAATLSDVDRFLVENFKSWYVQDDDDEAKDKENHERRGRVKEEEEEEEDDDDNDDDDHVQANGRTSSPILFDQSPRLFDLPAGVSGSNRFFIATGLSSSLIEEARSSSVTKTTISPSTTDQEQGSSSSSTSTTSTSTNNNNVAADDSNAHNEDVEHVMKPSAPSIPNECIAVLTYSPNPYDDFQRSMKEMVEARLKHHSAVDWEFMEELLFCYLNLNDKKSYKFILSAFVDLIVALRQNDRKIPARSTTRNSKVVVRDKRSRRTRHNHDYDDNHINNNNNNDNNVI